MTEFEVTKCKAKSFVDSAIAKIDEFMNTTIKNDDGRKPDYKILGFAQADLQHAAHLLTIGGEQDAERTGRKAKT